MAAARAHHPSHRVTGMSVRDAQQAPVDATAGSDTEQAAAHRARG
jgi:hypothetical protein